MSNRYVIQDLNSFLYLRGSASSQHEAGNWTADREEAAEFVSIAAATKAARAALAANPERAPWVVVCIPTVYVYA